MKSTAFSASQKPGSASKKKLGHGKQRSGYLGALGQGSDTPIVIDPDFLLNSIYKNDIDALTDAISFEDHPHFPYVIEKLPIRDSHGKTPLDLAAIIGRTECALSIVNSERDDINRRTSAGYTPLHLAAAWGRTDLVRRLVECGADMQQRTDSGERPREVAARYGQQPSVLYLDWAEARKALLDAIAEMQLVLQDKEKMDQVKLGKEDKLYATAACREKQDWFNNTPDATTGDYRIQRRDLEETLKPIWGKISAALAPPPPPQSASS